MTRTLLILFGGPILLVALATVPASARPLYQSDLVCKNSLGQIVPGDGFTVLKTNGDLYVHVQGLAASGPVSCHLSCIFSGQFSISPDCGGRVIGPGGRLTTIAPAESFVPNLTGACEGAFVQVFPAGDLFCRSGFTQ